MNRRRFLVRLAQLSGVLASGRPARRAVTAGGAGEVSAGEIEHGKEKDGMDIEGLLAQVRTPHKYGKLALAPSFKPGEFDSHAVDCPFVFRSEGRFCMTFIGFDGVGYRTGLASSDDLLNWRKEGLLVDRGPKGSVTEFNAALTWILRDNDLFGPGGLRKVNGEYIGAYHAYPRPGYETGPAVIGICSSKDLRNWVMREPCLRAEDGADWERGGLYKSCLAEFGGKCHMFYNAKNKESNWIEQTGVVTSGDLENWQRFEGNPVVKVSDKGGWDDRFASDPYVVKMGDCWAMFYYGLSSDGHAREGVAFSKDLFHWEKGGEVLIDVGGPGSVDSRHAHKPGIFHNNGVLYHYYCAVRPAGQGETGEIKTGEMRGISVATSKPVGG